MDARLVQRAVKGALIAGLIGVCACNSTQAPVPVPTDGVLFTGAVHILYPIAGGGQCVQNLGFASERFMVFTGPAEIGEPTIEMAIEPYTGRGKYEIDAHRPHGSWLWAEIKVSHQWIATSGEIIVTSEAGGIATGTVRATGLKDINDGSRVDVVGSWKCSVQDLTAPSPSPSPPSSPAVYPSPSPPPVGTPVASQVLAPAKILPAVPLCTAPVQEFQDGNVGPLLCRDGAINVLAWRYFAKSSSAPRVLGLGRGVRVDVIEAAVCSDVGHWTLPQEASAYALAWQYYGDWPHGFDPNAFINSGGCP